MDAQDLKELESLRGAITARSGNSEQGTLMAALYKKLSGRNMNFGCRPCIEDMLNYLNAQLQNIGN